MRLLQERERCNSMKTGYLSEEEQYKKILNQNEIARIKDYKYWHLRHKVFLDEHGVPDWKLDSVMDEIDAEEQAEIEAYRKRKGLV